MIFGGVAVEATTTEPYQAISYPLEMPSDPGLSNITWGVRDVIARAASPFTFKEQVHVHGGDGWLITIELPDMSIKDAGAWSSFFTLLGGTGTFLFGDVYRPSPFGLAWGSPEIDGNGQSGRVIYTKGWNKNITGILLPGDKIQIGQYLYQVTRAANTDVEGKAILDIYPRLRSAPVSGDSIVTQEARGVFRLAENMGSLSNRIVEAELCKMPSFTIVEAL